MLHLIVTFVVALLAYLFFTAGSGDVLLWSPAEILMGIVFALVVSLVAKNVFCRSKDFRMLNPARWAYFIAYLFPFFVSMARANLDVAYRVITGRINPGIVRVPRSAGKDEGHGLKTPLGITMLANSITLTPGTLSVDVDEETNDLYVHWINVKNAEEIRKRGWAKPSEVCGTFPKWIRRIAE
jgi:multicomponent Na+:H+ antiporter subunit E